MAWVISSESSIFAILTGLSPFGLVARDGFVGMRNRPFAQRRGGKEPAGRGKGRRGNVSIAMLWSIFCRVRC